MRESICKNLSVLGIEIDVEKNRERSSEERFISTKNSKVKVLVVPTNEELMIARESHRVMENNK